MMTKGLSLLALMGTCLAISASETPPAVRFAEVSLHLLTTGERQPMTVAGSFTASLPLGRAGGLHRTLTVANESRGVTLALDIQLTVTPTLDDKGTLHCVVLSEATPAGGASSSRAKDMAFTHPGEQVMELYADPSTGSRVALTVSASLLGEEEKPRASVFPSVLFLVRVEQWAGAQRVELENLQLQSLDGESVSHDYVRKLPRWVADTSPEGEPDPLSKLPVLDFSKGSPTVNAGEGFSIAIEPKAQDKDKKSDAPKPSDAANPTVKEPPRHLVWDQESYHLAIDPVAFDGHRLTIKVRVQGQILDPVTRKPLAPVELSVEKALMPGQPTPFYLTRESEGGPLGYALWVVPKWTTQNAEDQQPPAAEPGSAPAPKDSP